LVSLRREGIRGRGERRWKTLTNQTKSNGVMQGNYSLGSQSKDLKENMRSGENRSGKVRGKKNSEGNRGKVGKRKKGIVFVDFIMEKGGGETLRTV